MGVVRLQTPSTLREATVEHLRNEIIMGRLRPGKLLKRGDLAQALWYGEEIRARFATALVALPDE